MRIQSVQVHQIGLELRLLHAALHRELRHKHDLQMTVLLLLLLLVDTTTTTTAATACCSLRLSHGFHMSEGETVPKDLHTAGVAKTQLHARRELGYVVESTESVSIQPDVLLLLLLLLGCGTCCCGSQATSVLPANQHSSSSSSSSASAEFSGCARDSSPCCCLGLPRNRGLDHDTNVAAPSVLRTPDPMRTPHHSVTRA
mmetsp:Transcript_29335/g.49433  ORF Transcript_29335/g.49433 Transcript_29335/m.49433 type:complete len:200 (+) Transcript_29335:488-1087(+)